MRHPGWDGQHVALREIVRGSALDCPGPQLARCDATRLEHAPPVTTVARPSTTCMMSATRSCYSTSPGVLPPPGIDLVAGLVEQQPARLELLAYRLAWEQDRVCAVRPPVPHRALPRQDRQLLVLVGRRCAADADRADDPPVDLERASRPAAAPRGPGEVRRDGHRRPGPRSPCWAGGRSPRYGPCRSRRRRWRPGRRRVGRGTPARRPRRPTATTGCDAAADRHAVGGLGDQACAGVA